MLKPSGPTKLLRRSFSHFALALCACGALVVVGCGDGQPKTYPVTGTVTYQGQPVEGAQVMFTPTAGRAAEGTTDSAGKFTLTTLKSGDGALAGAHRVSITKIVTQASKDPDNPYGTSTNALPPRYANPAQSPLQKDVSASGPNDFTFDLTDS
jgi:hypothetical protein